MDLLGPFSCQLHHIAFDRLKFHIPFPCPATQSINIPLKSHCVFFMLNFPILISKHRYQQTVLFQTQYLMRCHLCTDRTTRVKNGALWDTRQNRSPVRLYSIYNNSSPKLGCTKCLFKIQYESVNLSSIVQDFSPVIYYRSQLCFTTMSFPECILPI